MNSQVKKCVGYVAQFDTRSLVDFLMSWTQLNEWWTEEVSADAAYESVVTPLLLDVLDLTPGSTYLDLGCGEGRVMRSIAEGGAHPIGIDIVPALASRATGSGPVVVAELPSLSFLKPDSVDGVYCVLVLEHIREHRKLFVEAARVTRPRGVCALVMNHPIWTAPGSTPISDDDGEVLWRSGDYFSDGESVIRAGDDSITFHHRSMAELLNAASASGWSLRRMIEQPHHEFADQGGIPRLLACRWQLLP